VPPPVDDLYASTIAFWRARLADPGYRGPWREPVERSALALELLDHAASGVLVDRDGPRPHAGAAAEFRRAQTLARAGQPSDARVTFEAALASANHLGLLSESVGPDGEQLGDFPHAATHRELISAALAIDALAVRRGPSGKT
jgi:hypothetical protein